MDEMFDLDLVLTIPQDSTIELNKCNPQEARSRAAAARLVIDEMPMAAADNGDQCTVCMNRFGSGTAAKKVPCGHVFHESCICEWLTVHNSCPLCRRKILWIIWFFHLFIVMVKFSIDPNFAAVPILLFFTN